MTARRSGSCQCLPKTWEQTNLLQSPPRLWLSFENKGQLKIGKLGGRHTTMAEPCNAALAA